MTILWIIAMQKLLTVFLQKKIIFAIFEDRNFNVTLANNVEFWTNRPSCLAHFQSSRALKKSLFIHQKVLDIFLTSQKKKCVIDAH